MEKLASLLRTKDWESPRLFDDDMFEHDIVYEFCDITEREMIEFIGDDWHTLIESGDIFGIYPGDVIYKWLEDEDFVYVPSVRTKKLTIRRFKKNIVSSILLAYRAPGEKEEE